MSRAANTFRRNDAKRLAQAVKSAGLKIQRIELDGGKVIIFTDNEGKASETTGNEWVIDEGPA